VGRTGILTPVAVMDPVSVGGVTITHATLHNMDQIERLGLKLGDTVIISRAGDVIPQITQVLTGFRTGNEKDILIPENCPIDGGKVIREGVFYKCSNPDCGARHKESLRHFVSRGAFNIEGMGPKIVERLMDEGLISDAADIFEIEKGDVSSLPRFGDKSAENLVSEISEKKKLPIERLIYSFGIKHVGEETARTLAKEIRGEGEMTPSELFDEFRSFDTDRLKDMPDVGPKVAEAIMDWFRDEKNKNLCEKLTRSGVRALLSGTEKTEGKLTGKTFVFTGTLSMLDRPEAKEMVIKSGGETSETVGKNTDYVVAGDNPGSKYDKAVKTGVTVLTEEDFLKLIKG